MRPKSLVVILAILGISLCTAAQDANASWDYPGYGCWGYSPFGWNTGYYLPDYVPPPPYYAVHPPVYYSGRIYRTYGDSPYAYPPRHRYFSYDTPVCSHRLILNPHVAQANPTVDEQFGWSNPNPQIIFNPFVDHHQEVAQNGSVTKPAEE